MFNFSLPQGLIGKILPASLERPFNSGDDNNNSGCSPIPPELLEYIIDLLHNDTPTLLTLGLTSKLTLIRSRFHLFETLEFNDSDKRFDAFLALLESPWTSFTRSVESLHITDRFHYACRYKYPPTRDIHRISKNLRNLKSLRLTALPWPNIPYHIRDLFFQLNIANLHLNTVAFLLCQQNDLVELFSRLQPSIKSLTLYNLQYEVDEFPDFSHLSSTFRRQIHLKALDNTSLLPFKDAWDPLKTNDLHVTVESFHLRLEHMSGMNREAYTPFISRFLQQVGPSLHHLFIKFDPYISSDALPCYASVDLSRCVNVRVIHVGTIHLDCISRSGKIRKMLSPMLSTMWAFLTNFSSNSSSLEEIKLIFRPYGLAAEGKAAELEGFPWSDFLGRMRDMFPNVKIVVCVRYYAVDDEDYEPFLKALRRAPGMRQLEEKGIVLLRMIPWHLWIGDSNCLQVLTQMYPTA